MTGLVLVAAGSGARFGSSVPKQFLRLNDKSIFLYSLETLADLCDEIVIPVSREWLDRVQENVSELAFSDRIRVVEGGSRRQDSVLKGLEALSPMIDRVLVHDAVRPWATRSLGRRVLAGLQQGPACVPVLPIAETVKEVDGNLVSRTLDRDRLRLTQTPQAFLRGVLERALSQASRQGIVGTDEAALVERTGERVTIVEGERRNIKITWEEDLQSTGTP